MRFLYNAAAIYHKGALIIGDTHFGIEERLRRRGVHASGISIKLAERIAHIVKKTHAKKLIILGDVKDRIGTCDNETKEALRYLNKLDIEIILVKGNHDGTIEELGFLGIRFIGPEGFSYEGIGLAHGHAWPSEECMNAKYLVSAHQHPMLAQTDRTGRQHNTAAWIIAPLNAGAAKKHYKKFNKNIRLILMPAFNPMVGTGLKHGADEHLGPLFRNKLFKYNDAISYSIKGSYLGEVKTKIKKPAIGVQLYGKEKTRTRKT